MNGSDTERQEAVDAARECLLKLRNAVSVVASYGIKVIVRQEVWEHGFTGHQTVDLDKVDITATTTATY